jgi:hypothetical protein
VVSTESALTVDIGTSVDPVEAGGRVSYTVTVGNRSATPVDNIWVLLRTPEELTFHSSAHASPNTYSGCGSNCVSTNEAYWSLGTLAAGETQTITVDAGVLTGFVDGTLIAAPIQVTATQVPDTMDRIHVIRMDAPSADLVLSASTDPVVPGQTFDFIVDIGNVSSANLTNADLSLHLPDGVSVNSASGGGTSVGNVINWSLGSVGVTQALRRTVSVTADASLAPGSVISATAELRYAGGIEVDNEAQHAVTVAASDSPLTLDIGTSVDPARAGGRVLYTITVGNHSPLPVDDIWVLLRTPEELTFHSSAHASPNTYSGCGSNCVSTNEAYWSLGTLAAGETQTITVDAGVLTGFVDGTLIAAPIQVTATQVPDTMDRIHVIRMDAPSADLVLSASTDPVVPGQTFDFIVDIGNVSSANLTNADLSLHLPDGVSVNSASGGGTSVGNVINWSLGSVGVTQALRRTVSVTADASLAPGSVISATAELRYAGGIEVDNEAQHAVTVAASDSPLTLDIGTSVDPARAGGRVLYTITVGNHSPLPVDDIWVLLRTPEELTFHSSAHASPNTYSGCGSNCVSTNEAYWSLGTLAAGETQTITVDAGVLTGFVDGTLIAAPIQVTATQVPDTMDRIHVIRMDAPSADLVLSASTDPVVPGQTFDFIVDIGNVSSANLTNADLSLHLPDGVSVNSASGGGTSVGNVINWSLGSVGVTQALRRTVSVTADASLAPGSVISATAELRYAGGIEVDNEAQHAVTVAASDSPLTLDIGTSVDPARAGGRVLYTITVGNHSPLPVDDIWVLLRTPEELTFHSSAHASPNTYSGCGSYCVSTNEAYWSLGTLAAGETQTITVDAGVLTGFADGTLITAPIQVTATQVPDTMDRIHVIRMDAPSADLVLSASTDPVVPGQTFDFIVDIGNVSSANLTNADLSLHLPDGVSVNSASGGGTSVGNVINWNLGSVGVTQALRRTVSVTADASLAPGSVISATAELRYAGGMEVDNEAQHAVTVAASDSPLTLDIGTSVDPARAGGRVLYTITVGNHSPLPVDDIWVLLRTPEELRFHSSAHASPNTYSGCGSYCVSTNEAYWSLGTLAAGQTQIITVDAEVLTGFVAGTLIVAPIQVTAAQLTDTIDRFNVVRLAPP